MVYAWAQTDPKYSVAYTLFSRETLGRLRKYLSGSIFLHAHTLHISTTQIQKADPITCMWVTSTKVPPHICLIQRQFHTELFDSHTTILFVYRVSSLSMAFRGNLMWAPHGRWVSNISMVQNLSTYPTCEVACTCPQKLHAKN